jgi:hypothetical protein
VVLAEPLLSRHFAVGCTRSRRPPGKRVLLLLARKVVAAVRYQVLL